MKYIHIRERCVLAETILVHLLEVEGREAFCMYTTTSWIFRAFYAYHFENYPTKIDNLLKNLKRDTDLPWIWLNLFLETIVNVFFFEYDLEHGLSV